MGPIANGEMGAMSCPPDEARSRAFTEGDPSSLEPHFSGCPRCRAEWTEWSELRALARAPSPKPLDPARVEDVRERLELAASQYAGRVRLRSTLRRSLAAFAAVALVVLSVRATFVADVREARGEISSSPGARFEHVTNHQSSGPVREDEVVRVGSGSLRVRVNKLRQGERFRVVTDDSEVEVRGTSFDVEVADGRLLGVRVIEGRVEVRPKGRESVVLTAGDSWSREGKAAATAELAGKDDSRPPADDHVVPTPADAAVSEAPIAAAVASGVEARSSAQEPLGVRRPRRGALAESSGSRASMNADRPLLAEPAEAPAREPIHSPPSRVERSDAPSIAPPAQARVPEPTHPASADEEAFARGWDALRRSDFRAAAAALGEVSEGSTISEEAGYWRSVAFVRSGDRREGARAFDEFFRRFPGSQRGAEASLAAGWNLFDLGRHEEARVAFERAARSSNPALASRARKGLEATQVANGAR